METPVNRSCPGWRSKVRAALAALGGATRGTSRGGCYRSGVAPEGQSSTDGARAVLSARGVLLSARKGKWAVNLKGGGAVNLDVDVGYSRRRCGWQIMALPNKMSPSSITT